LGRFPVWWSSGGSPSDPSWDMAARCVANGVADEGGRQRDLLPLPVPRADLRHEGPRLSQLSRGTQQRVTQRHAVRERVAESVWALNALHGADGRADGQSDGPISDAQHAALGHVSACVDRCKPPVSSIPDQEALRELLRSDARYSGGECTGNVAPYGAGEVSLPPPHPASPLVQSVLRGEDADKFVRFRECMLRSDLEYQQHISERGEPRCYMDPVLERDSKAYVR
jgi:hypothetical protein